MEQNVTGYLIYLLPLALVLFFYLRRRGKKEQHHITQRKESVEAGVTEPASLHPVFDPNRCIGSGACVTACPEQAIGLIKGKGHLVKPTVCIGHGACMAATLGAMEHKLRSVTVEQEDSLGGAVYHYPRNKIVMTAPMRLPIIGKVKMSEISKEALLEFWQGAARKTGLKINFSERMETITKKGNGFIVKTSRNSYDTRAVLLAIGRRGPPREPAV